MASAKSAPTPEPTPGAGAGAAGTEHADVDMEAGEERGVFEEEELRSARLHAHDADEQAQAQAQAQTRDKDHRPHAARRASCSRKRAHGAYLDAVVRMQHGCPTSCPRSCRSRRAAVVWVWVVMVFVFMMVTLPVPLILWSQRGRIATAMGVDITPEEAVAANIPLHHVTELPPSVHQWDSPEMRLNKWKEHRHAPTLNAEHVASGCDHDLMAERAVVRRGMVDAASPWGPFAPARLGRVARPVRTNERKIIEYIALLGVLPLDCATVDRARDLLASSVVDKLGKAARHLAHTNKVPCVPLPYFGWNVTAAMFVLSEEDVVGATAPRSLLALNPAYTAAGSWHVDFREPDVVCMHTTEAPMRDRVQDIEVTFQHAVSGNVESLRVGGMTAIHLQHCIDALHANPCSP